jgi:hypothetical protein
MSYQDNKKQGKMMLAVRQAIGDDLGELVEYKSSDEVVYKIQGERQARERKRKVEEALRTRLKDRISFRVELFRLSIEHHDGYRFFTKTNIETNLVQVKMLTPIGTP